MAATNSEDPRLAGRVAFTYTFARFFIVLALEMQSVAVGWQVYEITKSPLDLGYVGLAQFAPPFLLFLVAGHAVDRFDRRKLLMWCYAGYGLCSAFLLAISWQAPRSAHSIRPYSIYVVLVLVGVVRSFSFPVSRAILPHLVPEEHFLNAVAWNSSTFQIATIAGPAVGGIAYAAFEHYFKRGPEAVYAIAVAVSILSVALTLRIRLIPQSPEKELAASAARKEPMSLRTVLAGFHFIWVKRLILGSISLDMFAVLLGGAVALLPVYAREILHTGPWGLGLLRTAPAVGAAAMAVLLAYRPLKRRVGATMLWCVSGFGVFTIVFGISRSLIVSLLALVLVGATDMVSVVIRATLVQLLTPDQMRGRVNAVDMMFIGASNQLGEFESGATAHLFGTVPAVILGGVGTLIVTAIWAWRFPELRRADTLTPSGN